METILDFTVELNIPAFDNIVNCFYKSTGDQQKQAKQILEQFQEHPDAWKRVDGILEKSTLAESKFVALQILEKVIKVMWKVLPLPQRQGIKNFIVAVIIKTSCDQVSLEKNKTLLGKLNIVLVQILKQDWPHNWPSFIPEIVSSSKSNLFLCENNMGILKLLSEEIFDFSAEQMTQAKQKNLKNQMCGEFSEIFQLCFEVLEKAEGVSLLKATLETLLRFLNWIPLGYIFETNLIQILHSRFFTTAQFKNVTLKCFTEIAGLQVGPEYNDKFVILFDLIMSSVSMTLPMDVDLSEWYEYRSDEEQNYVANLAIFLSTFLAGHIRKVEAAAITNPRYTELITSAHTNLLRISLVKDREIFKICLEYWAKLVADLYDQVQSLPNDSVPLLNLAPLRNTMNTMLDANNNSPLRRNLYSNTLSTLRVVMIERMVKPEEVLIVENDEGEIVREFMKEGDTISLYKSMREVLVYLTHLDTRDTEHVMTEKLSKQMDGSEWSWDNINKLCWAIGSISGAMSEEVEKRFLVTVIKDLLSLTEMKRGKDNKAVVASNIMYIVGQYPRFLKAHWKFLKTVVNKLFEFMHELHEGVQDMACDTFIKIAQKCKRHFCVQQPNEFSPFIDEIIRDINQIISELSPQQVHTFYEALGHVISAQANVAVAERLVIACMETPNAHWDEVMKQASVNVDVLNNPEVIKVLANVIKTNVALCSSVGSVFSVQMGRIYMDLLSLYRAVSGLVSESILVQGPIAAKTPKVRAYRTIKKEVLKLIDAYIQKVDDLNAVKMNIIPPLCEAVLGDYSSNVEPAKDAEVLNVFANIIFRLQSLMTDRAPAILGSVFECTLNMINKNFEEYPEHRVAFFKLLQAINQECFPALLTFPEGQFRLFLDSIVWAFKHTMRDIGDMGLLICTELLTNFSKSDPSVCNRFFKSYFISILQDVFFVLTSTSHKAGFRLQSMIMSQLFGYVNSGLISVPLYDPGTVSNELSNVDYIREYVVSTLHTAFPHLQLNQIRHFVLGLFELNKDHDAFKSHLRDFLITLKEFQGEDSVDLYISDREAEQALRKQQEFEAALRIPGMVKPADRPDDGMVD